MSRWFVLPLLLLTFTLTPDLTRALTPGTAVDLINFLFNSDFYNRQVRPVASYNETMPVLMQYDLLSLLEVDSDSQTMTTLGRLHMYWVDHLLQWNSSNHRGIPEMLVKQGDVWVPDIVLTNSLQEPEIPGHKELPLYLQQCGSIYWNPIIKAVSRCDVNIKYFPFDYQLCHLEFGTEMSLAFEVEVFIHSKINKFWEPVSLFNYQGNEDWDLVETSADSLRNNDVKEEKIRFSFLLQRKNTSAILTLVLPLIFLSLSACLVFVLPSESGEKVTTGLTILVAYVIYLGLFSSQLPDTALRVSVLTVYLLCLLTLVILVVVVSGITVRIYHRPVWDPVSPVLTRFTRRINGQSRKLDQVMSVHPSVSSFKEMHLPTPDYPSLSPHKPRKNIASTAYQLNASSGFIIGGASFASTVNGDVLPGDVEVIESKKQVKAKAKAGKAAEKEHAEMLPVTWPEVAKAMDRLCLVMFIVLITLTTAIFVLVITVGGASDKPELTPDKVDAMVDFSPYYNQLCCGYDCIATNATSYNYRRK